MFDCILIANRGEIACRIIRTARRLGIRTVAVHSNIEAQALHVEMADAAVLIGGASAGESYLNGTAIIEAARARGAQAIHPGYGFLSENAQFAEDCSANGIVFIGPPASAMRAMASKSAAKQLMQASDVPVLPGYHGDAQDKASLEKAAHDTGFPLMLKASAGGGGKGMRIVYNASEFDTQLDAVKREATASFGDDHVLLERYVEHPRHIEIQIFSDQHNNHLHLFERDCSVQRRHQKVLEEAPAPGLDEATRQKMGQAAINAARAVGYVGAGTVEFIADTDGSFYFMEMNTRLQVEHPVTEMITGQDLVEWQLRVANNELLPLSQTDLKVQGHAIEARLYAEDPDNEFLPASGKLRALDFPSTRNRSDIRIETGVRAEDAVSVHYDPMIAKVIAHGADREQAIRKLEQTLAETHLVGPASNLQYLGHLLTQPGFIAGGVTTRFIESISDSDKRESDDQLIDWRNAISAVLITATTQLHQRLQVDSGMTGWRLNLPPTAFSVWELDGSTYQVNVQLVGTNNNSSATYQLVCNRTGDTSTDNDITAKAIVGSCKQSQRESSKTWQMDISVNDQNFSCLIVASDSHFVVYPHDRDNKGTKYPHSYRLQHIGLRVTGHADDNDGGNLQAPMPGKVVAVNIAAGDRVEKGQTLMVVEAMKMEHAITAPVAGEVAEVCYSVGDGVDERSTLIRMTDGF